MSGGQDPPHLRNRLKHVLREIEAERGNQPPSELQRPQHRQCQREAVTGDVRRGTETAGTLLHRGTPIGLSRAQLGGQRVTRARQAIPVVAWLPFTGGAYHRVRAWAGEWTSGAVHLRFRDSAGAWDLWVHAVDVQRTTPKQSSSPPPTRRPDAPTYPSNRNPRRPTPE